MPTRCASASGEFIGVINAGDELAPEALFELVKRLNDSDADIVYSDEDWLSETGRREDPLFKPDWGPDLLLSSNYLERFGIFRRQLVVEIGGFRAAAGQGQVYDLVLRLTERTAGSRTCRRCCITAVVVPTTADAVAGAPRGQP